MNKERNTPYETKNLEHNVPPLLERPLAMSLQAGSIIRNIEQLTKKSATSHAYSMNDSLYALSFKPYDRWRSASIEQTVIDTIETDPESGDEIIHGGDEITAHIQQRNDGATRIIVKTEMFDASGVSYKGESTYEFTPYRPMAQHEGHSFTFHYQDKKPYANKKVTDQELLFFDIKELLDSMEYTITTFMETASRVTTKQATLSSHDAPADMQPQSTQSVYNK